MPCSKTRLHGSPCSSCGPSEPAEANSSATRFAIASCQMFANMKSTKSPSLLPPLCQSQASWGERSSRHMTYITVPPAKCYTYHPGCSIALPCDVMTSFEHAHFQCVVSGLRDVVWLLHQQKLASCRDRYILPFANMQRRQCMLC